MKDFMDDKNDIRNYTDTMTEAEIEFDNKKKYNAPVLSIYEENLQDIVKPEQE
jgi:hypothetical protein